MFQGEDTVHSPQFDGFFGHAEDDAGFFVLGDRSCAGVLHLFQTFRAIGVDLMFDHIKESLHEFGTDFDVYTHEDSMHTSGRVHQAIDKLRDNGSIYEQDGAI